METVFPEGMSRGAYLFRKLKGIGPGQAMKVPREILDDCDFPVNPLGRQDLEFKVEWLRSRMPFYCTTQSDIISGDTIFERPKLTDSQPK